jgi:predicted  nucleic acid-binding Zn-ribbon protein
MHRCGNCGSTAIDDLEPLDNGSIYCGGCDRVTRPEERTPPPAPERERRDLQ